MPTPAYRWLKEQEGSPSRSFPSRRDEYASAAGGLPGDDTEVEIDEENRKNNRPERPDLGKSDFHARPPKAGTTSCTTMLVSTSAR